MQTTETSAPVEPVELNDVELNDVAGAGLPLIAPAKGKCPTAVE